jgi:MoaA/NifB/PqqE/SkfB family radical SAM enzyme
MTNGNGSRNRGRFASTNAIAAAMGVASLAPDLAARGLSVALARSAKTKQQKMIAEWTKSYLAPGTPGAAYFRRLLTQLHPNVRKRFLAGFIGGLFYRDPELADRIKAERGITLPLLLAISPSMACNLRCTGCYAGNYDRHDDLPFEVVDRVVTEAEELGIRVFIIIGGEPLHWPHFLELCEKHRDSVFQPYTNALYIDDAYADKLQELGNIGPSVSIEGLRDATDGRRGKGVFDKVMAAMDRLRERGIMFSFSATATRHNIDEITGDEFIDLMIQKGCLYGWIFAYAPVGLDPDPNLMPTPELRDRLRREVNRIRKEKPILLADFWNDGALAGGCISAGRKYLHINNRGDVEPCVFCHFAVDNIRETPLLDALSSDFFKDIRSMQPFGHNLLRPCPLIDHPAVMQKMVQKHGAYATHPGAESLVTDLAEHLEGYSTELKDLYADVWDGEYAWASEWLEQDKEWNIRRDKGCEADEEVISADEVPA